MKKKTHASQVRYDIYRTHGNGSAGCGTPSRTTREPDYARKIFKVHTRTPDAIRHKVQYKARSHVCAFSNSAPWSPWRAARSSPAQTQTARRQSDKDNDAVRCLR